MKFNIGICPGYFIFACSFFICCGFAVWLCKDSDRDKIRDFYYEYRRLILHEKYQDAIDLHAETLAENKGDELDVNWLPLVKGEPDGYKRLGYYQQILAGNPGREDSYKEIALLIDSLPDSFEETRSIYLADLQSISAVRMDLLEKYGLLASPR